MYIYSYFYARSQESWKVPYPVCARESLAFPLEPKGCQAAKDPQGMYYAIRNKYRQMNIDLELS